MASGDSLVQWFPRDAELPDADAAELGFKLVASADEPDDHLMLVDFDPGGSPNEHCEFSAIMSRQYGGGGITVWFQWMSQTATTGDVRWEIAFKSFTDDVDNLDTKAYASAQGGYFPTDTFFAGRATIDSLAFTDGAQMDNIAAGEYFRMRLTRDAADSGDTMNSDDARLLRIDIRET
jgi:hypothetical protein